MAERVIFVPAGPDFLRGMSVTPQMVQDLLAISTIPIEQIEAIGAAIDSEVGFSTPSQLESLVQEIVRNEGQASAVVSALYNVQPVRVGSLLNTLREWRISNPENGERFSSDAFASIEENLPRLVREYSAVERCRKATRLKSILGNRAEAIELICDVRPVFNSARDAMEGMIPILTLKVSYEDQENEAHSVEVGLSEAMLEEMLEKCQKAQEKLLVINQSVPEWLPDGLVQFED